MIKRYVLLLAVLLVLVPVPVLAAQGEVPSLNDVLKMLVGPLSAVVAGVIMSVLIEMSKKFQALDKKWKYTTYFLLCLFISVGAHTLAVAFGYWGSFSDPEGWWKAVYSGLVASGIGGLFHQWTPSPFTPS